MAAKSSYLVLVKYIKTEVVAEGPYFSERKKALAWVKSQIKTCEGRLEFMLKKV
jgi:hypothetical protein